MEVRIDKDRQQNSRQRDREQRLRARDRQGRIRKDVSSRG